MQKATIAIVKRASAKNGRRVAAGLRAIDLFAGAGGLSCGFEWVGGRVVGGVEIDEDAASTFKANHKHAKVWTCDIRQLSVKKIAKEIGPIDVVIAGPMCQGVSQRGPRDPKDERNFAFWTFAKFVRALKPKYFLMENVPALASDVHNRSLAVAVFEELESLGYHLAADVMNAAWFGVPQLRYRTVVLGSRDSQPYFPAVAERGVLGRFTEAAFTTVGEAIMDLPRGPAGGGEDDAPLTDPREPLSEYAAMMREGARRLYNHWSADTEEVNLARIRCVPEGGNWHNIRKDILPRRFLEVRPSDHTTTYRRLDRTHPAHTVTTECGNVTSGAFTHPRQNRAITVREAARLQGFPDRFRFIGPRGAQYKQAGNAVPPLMAKQLFEALLGRVPASMFKGRITLEVLRKYPDDRLPFTLAPRYKPLFGQSTGATRRRNGQLSLAIG